MSSGSCTVFGHARLRLCYDALLNPGNNFGALFRLWLPLAVSFELMMLEGPVIQAAIGRLPEPALALAAWGLTMSLSLLIESPVIMLLATAIALVRDRDSFLALKTFTLRLAAGCTLLTALVAFTPLFDLITGPAVMGQPPEIAAQARPAMQIMLLWTGAIAWRRFFQGVLVRYGQTFLVSWGTAIRLAVVCAIAFLLVRQHLPGAVLAAVVIMGAVLSEAAASTLFARPLVRRLREEAAAPDDPTSPPLTQRAILRFHTPLAATTLLTLLAQPMTAAALARLPHPGATLAAWPLVFMVLLVLRGWGLSVQEITVAQARRGTHSADTLRRFAWLVGAVTSGAAVLLAATPLLAGYLIHLLRAPADLHPYVRVGVAVGALSPLLTTLGSWARGLLVAAGRTGDVYRGMGVSLATHAALLVLGIVLQLPGIPVAAVSFSVALVAEYLYLARGLSAARPQLQEEMTAGAAK